MSGRRRGAQLLSIAAASALAACGGDGGGMGPVTVDAALGAPQLLSETNLFRYEDGRFSYNDGVLPYDLNSPLFSDYALKRRAIWLPEGGTARVSDNEVLEFPVGTAIVKSFLLPADLRAPDVGLRLIETRLLLHESDGWESYPYVWDEALQDHQLKRAGKSLPIDFIDAQGQPRTAQYLVPQRNQCLECHELQLEGDPETTFMTPIGPKLRHLNRDYAYEDGTQNQITRMRDLGWLPELSAEPSALPAAFDFDRVLEVGAAALEGAELNTAARDYMDINCAHCHNPRGVQGVTSQLFLNHDNDDPFRLGICKKPGSAGKGGIGREFDIVPGDPDASILVFRVETLEQGAMMPLLGRSLTHDEGAALLRRWVAQMPPDDCQ